MVPESGFNWPILSISKLFMRFNSTGRHIRGFGNASNVLWSFLELIEYRKVFGGMFDARQARMRDRQERDLQNCLIYGVSGMQIKSMVREKGVPKRSGKNVVGLKLEVKHVEVFELASIRT